MPPAVTLDHLTKSFGSLTAVDDIDLSIRPGEVVAFLGPNGAGKTTTIDMLLGLSRPDEGSVEIFGMPPRRAVSRGLVSSVMQTGGGSSMTSRCAKRSNTPRRSSLPH